MQKSLRQIKVTMMTKNKPTLYYAHDPMCSWCYGFRPVWQEVTAWCHGKFDIQYLMGGLAPDTDNVMPQHMQNDIQSCWHKIQQDIPGTQFNFDFWLNNTPRRATYRACRAVICARIQAPEKHIKMIELIQNAYYQQAQNPSDRTVLIECAQQCALDSERFGNDLDAPDTHDLLTQEIRQCHTLGLHSFPSLLLKKSNELFDINIDYNQPEAIIASLRHYL